MSTITSKVDVAWWYPDSWWAVEVTQHDHDRIQPMCGLYDLVSTLPPSSRISSDQSQASDWSCDYVSTNHNVFINAVIQDMISWTVTMSYLGTMLPWTPTNRFQNDYTMSYFGWVILAFLIPSWFLGNWFIFRDARWNIFCKILKRRGSQPQCLVLCW